MLLRWPRRRVRLHKPRWMMGMSRPQYPATTQWQTSSHRPIAHINMNFGLQSLHSHCYSSNESSASYWNENRVNIGNLFKNLQSNRSLTCENINCIISVDVLKMILFRVTECKLFRHCDTLSLQNYGCTKTSAELDLHERCNHGHHHSNRNVHLLSVVTEGESMVSSACSDDSLPFQFRRQFRKGVTSSSLLEWSGHLEILFLEEKVHFELRRQLQRSLKLVCSFLVFHSTFLLHRASSELRFWCWMQHSKSPRKWLSSGSPGRNPDRKSATRRRC